MKMLLYRAAGCLLGLVAASFAFAVDDPMGALQKSAGEWVRVRMETARLESGWRAERALLESTLTALQERATLAEEERDLLRAKTAKEREELSTLEAKEQQSAESLRQLETRLKTLSGQLRALRPNLPPRLSSALEMSFRSLTETDAPLGERLQTCMTVLNRCVQFNRLISAGEESLQVAPGGETKSLEVIYWGLSHGYALDRSAGQAWLGSPGPTGWHWEPQPDAADEVAQLIAIHQDKADPDFVIVPAALRQRRTEAQP